MPALPCIELTPQEKRNLLCLARQSLQAHFDAQAAPAAADEDGLLRRRLGCFVSLYLDDELSGCMGNIDAERPLGESIPELALCSGFQDPRFPPLGWEQMPRLTIEISLLSPLSPLPVSDEDELLQYLAEHPCGVVLSDAVNRAVYLPHVWEQLPEPAQFIGALKRKGGWPVDYWSSEMGVELFTAVRFSENESSGRQAGTTPRLS